MRQVLFSFFLLSSLLIPGRATLADDEIVRHRLGDLTITDPWAKSAIGEHNVKLFFEFQNHGDRDDQLLAFRSSINHGENRIIAVEAADGKRALSDIPALILPAGGHTFELSEIGYFLQLDGLDRPILMGSTFTVELVFERAGTIEMAFSGRFHSPKLTRRIRAAAERGDIEALRALRPAP
ncbi:MAG: copper chaperone PCu(A)C [Pseudomonadota bacterium]